MTVSEAVVFLEKHRKGQKKQKSNIPFPDALWELDLPNFLRSACVEALNSRYRCWAAMAMLSCLYREEWDAAPYPADSLAVPFEIEKTGRIILPAFNQHTEQGKTAYNLVRNIHPAYFIQNDGKRLTDAMFGPDVFRAESEILHNRVGSPSTMHLYDEALDECWRAEGRDPAEARKSVRRINRNLEPLNVARRKVME